MTSGLKSWDDEYQNDPVWEKVKALLEAFDEPADLTDAEKLEVKRNQIVLRSIMAYRNTPSLLVTPTAFSTLNAVIDNARARYDTWIANNRRADLFRDVTTYTLQAADQIRSWPNSPRENLQRAASTLREADRALDNAFNRFEERYSQRLAELEETFDTKHTELERQIDALSSQQTEINAAAATANREFSDLTTSTRTQLDKWQQAFLQAQEERSNAFQQLKSDADDELRAAHETMQRSLTEFLATQKSSAEEILTDMRKSSGVTGDIQAYMANKATSDYYGGLAAEEKRNADILRVFAIFTYILAAVVGIGWVFAGSWTNVPTDTWHTTLLKWTITVAIIGAGAYMTKESGDHRKRQTAAKKTELTLRVAGPYLAALDPIVREQFTHDTARHLFLNDFGLSSPVEAETAEEWAQDEVLEGAVGITNRR